ncbi:MAG: 2-oxoacid:ferredoxin oxidoreductase subunit alpha [Campylobacterota bacterium]|nr:2-oxoacid:ferredoxin oxidoreductase subunit alpha [Campylobacterota bacterium]
MNKKEMKLNKVEVWDGNMAASQAFRQADVDVVAAYPITPSTPTVENYAGFHANGYIDGEFVMVESEHAAMSGCVGASAAGGRVATATSSQGFALMVEVLYQAAGMRMPIVLAQINRALAAPLNVNGDHSDMYLGRDTGWINMDACSPQEAYDLTLCAFKIGEHLDVRLPVIVNQDGFMTSHTAQNVNTLTDEVASKFVGKYQQVNAMLNFDKPVTHGVQTEEDWHFEHKAKQHNVMLSYAPKVISEVFAEYETLTGRKYDFVESYNMEDAEVAIIALGTTYESAKVASDKMRAQGIKAGILMPRVIRPFPLEQICEALQNVKAIACMDRSAPGGTVGMLYNEISGALFNSPARPVLSNIIYGLGGRDMTIDALCDIYSDLDKEAASGKLNGTIQRFVGVRGPELAFYNA